ncbi:hypothetical protein M0R45_033554 [Rubus argutus]|uniref:Chitinase domain-containing protein 1 n=1 Tax=Rubus argutus TaxID=59490 RepID=A0AAW1WK84_RUBAR
MAKKRDRRVAPSSDGRKDRVESSHQLAGSASSSNRKLIITFVLFFIVSSAISILVYRLNYAPITDRTDSYVYRRGLVKPDVNYQDILTLTLLHGILRAMNWQKGFNSKFTHLSPIWYDLRSQGTSLIMEGRHNADMGWISDLRMAGDAWVLPRVVLEAFPAELLTKKKQSKAINLIVSECKEMGYDGIVLESWSRWAAYNILHDPKMRNLALQFIKDLGDALHAVTLERKDKKWLQLIYVIGPPHSEKLQVHDFGPKDLRSLSDAVDGFSLMTYDFSGPHNPVLLASKILLGINFYGNDFILSGGPGGGAITGGDYLSLLEKHKPAFRWEKNSAEHLFFYSDDKHNNHAVFYPSLMSISMRLEEARKWGCGISIWEIGQGLDYFYDLL